VPSEINYIEAAGEVIFDTQEKTESRGDAEWFPMSVVSDESAEAKRGASDDDNDSI
jgi:hypothetical protein